MRGMFDRPIQNRANVFVSASAKQYVAMVDKIHAKGTNPLDWRYDPAGRPGVWVIHDWLVGNPERTI